MTLEPRPNLKRVGLWVIALLITLGPITVQQGYAQEEGCTLATLNGSYVFDATGYNIVNSSSQPKAVVESLALKGDGTLTSQATVSINGSIHRAIPASGSYTVNADCTGTLAFNPQGPHFDLFIAPDGGQFLMVQTDANTVLAGVSRKVSE